MGTLKYGILLLLLLLCLSVAFSQEESLSVSDLVTKLKSIKLQLTGLKEESQALRKNLSEQSGLILNLQNSLNETEKSLLASEKKIQSLEKEIENRETSLAELRTSVEASEQLVRQLRKDLTELSERYQKLLRSSRIGKIKVGLGSGAVGLVVGALAGGIVVYFLSR